MLIVLASCVAFAIDAVAVVVEKLVLALFSTWINVRIQLVAVDSLPVVAS